jgi:type IV pilus assembly protein PilN
MPHINLLPWRDELRKRREKEFIVTAVAAAVLMGAVVFGVHLHYNGLIDHQNTRNQLLETEIAALNKKIEEIQELQKERDRLIARTKVIQELQAGRPEIVHVFEEIVRTLPDGVYYTKIAQNGRKLSLQGVAQSNARVSSLMRSLEASAYFQDPRLEVITTGGEKGKNDGTGVRLSEFKLDVNQAAQKKPEDEKSKGG